MEENSTEQRIAGFINAYSPEIAGQLIVARARLHELFPTGYELVYDNYNALVFGFGPTVTSQDAILSLAGYPRWTTLFFLHGSSLEDPDSILQGTGKHSRSIRLAGPEDLDRPEVLAMIDRARQPVELMLAMAPELMTIIKSVSANQRPRRPKS
ncbi:MAG: hypothetical protein R3C44_17245 [Chloroflexota bacterium]